MDIKYSNLPITFFNARQAAPAQTEHVKLINEII